MFYPFPPIKENSKFDVKISIIKQCVQPRILSIIKFGLINPFPLLNNLILHNSHSKLFSRDLQVTAHTFRGKKDIYTNNQHTTNWFKIKIIIWISCRTLKDGYESDSTLVYRKHHYTPCASPSPQAKALYTQVQKGGEVPLQGLRMQAPEKKGK